MVSLAISGSKPHRRRNTTMDNLFQQFLTTLKVTIFVSGLTSLSFLTVYAYPTFKFICFECAPRYWTSVCNFLTPLHLFLLLNFIIITLSLRASYHRDKGKRGAASGVSVRSEGKSVLVNYVVMDGIAQDQMVSSRVDSVDKSASMSQSHEEETEDKSQEAASTSYPEGEDLLQLEEYQERPLVSSRFTHRRPVKGIFDPKPLGINSRHATKKGDTMEGTWKAICEKRHPPLNRYLRKSKSFDSSSLPRSPTFSKTEIFNSNARAADPLAHREKEAIANLDIGTRAPLKICRREPSMSAEELNKKVEVFISQFNEQIRLQRQESKLRYMETVRRGIV